MAPRVPPSTKPPPAQPPPKIRRTRSLPSMQRPTGPAAPRESEAMSPEAKLWGGEDMDRSLEVQRKDVESRLMEAEAAEGEQAQAAHEQHAAAHEHEAKGGWAAVKQQMQKLGTGLTRALPGGKPPAAGQPAGGTGSAPQLKGSSTHAQGPARTGGTGASPQLTPSATSASASRLSPIGAVPTALSGSSARAERPPDAFALLKEAREKGVLFVEDATEDGHSEDQEDPILAAAVEECIRICFGLRGILRIGPGRNDRDEAIIVVSTSQGFSESSLAGVPPQVHGFPTLIAIPFELLPLRRER